MERVEGAVHRVIHPHQGHGSEEVVGMEETDGVPGHDGGVAEGLSQEALAHPCGIH